MLFFNDNLSFKYYLKVVSFLESVIKKMVSKDEDFFFEMIESDEIIGGMFFVLYYEEV